MVIPVGTTIEQAEKSLIMATLGQFGGNKSKTADVLGIARKTLHRKIKDYQLEQA